MKQWYQALFGNYGQKYDSRSHKLTTEDFEMLVIAKK
jgi:hypothetical protein